MSLQIGCPQCGKILTASPQLAGRKVACPRCGNRFRIGGQDAAELGRPLPGNQDYYPPGAGPPITGPAITGPAITGPAITGPAITGPAITGPAITGPAGTGPAITSPAGTGLAGTGLAGTGLAGTGLAGTGLAGTGLAAEGPGVAKLTGPDLSASLPAERDAPPAVAAHYAARFIERDPNATEVKLGSDGQLPDLALNAETKHEEAAEKSTSASPLVLIGVLCVSVLTSVGILIVDEPTGGVGQGKTEARQALQATFDSWDDGNPPNREVRDLLALVIQAYNRGDLQEERGHCRKLMDFLNREDAPKYGGFTGSDGPLKEALSELLR